MKTFDKSVGAFVDKAHIEANKARWQSRGIATQSSFFGMDKVLELLSVPGATGLRIHYGMDEEGNMQPILTAELATAADDGPGLNASYPCPPYC